jgi:hypothetical protein
VTGADFLEFPSFIQVILQRPTLKQQCLVEVSYITGILKYE